MGFDEDGHSLISIKQMAYLNAPAEHGSISAAARALRMAQPSLSENITRLEQSLGVQLAMRGSRGVQMTEVGARLALRSAEIIARIDEAVAEVRTLSTASRGVVNLGITPGLSLMLSVPLLETVYAEHPDIRLSITEGLSGDILEWIEEGRIDLGCVHDAYESPVFQVEPLLTEEHFVVTAPDNWDGEIGIDGLAVEPIDGEQLAGLPIVLTSSLGAQALQHRVSKALAIRLNIIATLNSLPQIVEMVRRASACSVLTHGSVYRQVARRELALVRIEGAPLIRMTQLVRRRNHPPSHAAGLIGSYVKTLARESIWRHNLLGTHTISGEHPS